jgi:hypothetical protein
MAASGRRCSSRASIADPVPYMHMAVVQLKVGVRSNEQLKLCQHVDGANHGAA